MNPAQISKMVLSYHEGWDELIRFHRSISRIFALVVSPLSILPPAMIYYAGGNYGDIFAAGVSSSQWHMAAGNRNILSRGVVHRSGNGMDYSRRLPRE